MRINIKIHDGTSNTQSAPVEVSKMAVVQVLKSEINKIFKIPESNQMMVYFGKMLEDKVAILDYKIVEGGTVNLYVRANGVHNQNEALDNKTEDETDKSTHDQDLIETESKFYKIGSIIDVILDDTGAWYEGIVSKIFRKKKDEPLDNHEKVTNDIDNEKQLIFRITSAEHIIPTFEVDAKYHEIRPRSAYIYKNEELCPGLIVLANYNLEEKKSRGLWYNFKIGTVTRTNLNGTILVGNDQTPIENCSIVFRDEVMRIEKPDLWEQDENDNKPKCIPRKYPYNCNKCRDNKTKKCRDCGCKMCAGKENWDKILLCDECDDEYHIYCLDPPLDKIPSDDWYCPECKVDDSQIVKKGEIKLTKKQANMPNKKTTSNRDWGRGMACAGRTKVCTIVPKNHFGPIPGIDVGTCWLFRMQVSEAGVHRPAVSGIHGVANEGAYSLVISAGYEDDIDKGEEFIYTGSGGRDLGGNKRVNVQSSDQVLTSVNKALAKNCNAPFNEEGAEAQNWKKGKPVRVIRNYKASKHSKFAPKAGNRYDGIYKVVKYYPERGKSGFIVWKFLMRRDDPAPAPWKKGGQEFDMIYPPLYLEMEAQKKQNKENGTTKPGPSGNGKRKMESNALTDFLNLPKKKPKLTYELPPEVKALIEKDKANSKYWSECNEILKDGKPNYLAKVQETFTCICCQDLVYEPVTLECKHNFCKECLKRAFKSKLFTCPCCRNELGENYHLEVNDSFSEALKLLFPGYGPGS